MSTGFRVFLDTCVLFPPTLRDVLLTAAENDLFYPLWSFDVLDELERNLVKRVNGLTRAQAVRVRSEMEDAFPDSTIRGYEPLIESMKNHEGDQHVTENLRHFSQAACDPYQIRPRSVDDFLSDLLSVDYQRMCDVFKIIERDRRNLPLTESVRRVGLVAPRFQRSISFHLGI